MNHLESSTIQLQFRRGWRQILDIDELGIGAGVGSHSIDDIWVWGDVGARFRNWDIGVSGSLVHGRRGSVSACSGLADWQMASRGHRNLNR